MIDTDIDIDFADRKRAVADLACVAAVMIKHDERRPHASGVYFQDIPTDPLDGMAVWDYEAAKAKGYFKLDLLSNSLYLGVRNEAHLVDLLLREPPWQAFDEALIVARLSHIGNHFPLVQQIKPRCIEDVAVCIALIRPGKRHLIGRPRSQIDQEIWSKTEKYHFKRSHAIAFAASIVVQLNLLIEQLDE